MNIWSNCDLEIDNGIVTWRLIMDVRLNTLFSKNNLDPAYEPMSVITF
jgi:hypothetical protein